MSAPATIAGVDVRPLTRLVDERGTLCHMLRADDPAFTRFGEIYFSGVYPGAIKAWRRHRRSTSRLAVPVGDVRLVLFDARADSPTAGTLQIVETGESRYALVTVPPGVWSGWQGLGASLALVANCATDPHDPGEVDRLDHDSPEIPYTWSLA